MSRINSSFKGTPQDPGTDAHYDFVSYEGEPLKASGRGHSYMGTLEDTVSNVNAPIHTFSDEEEDDNHGHTTRDITPG